MTPMSELVELLRRVWLVVTYALLIVLIAVFMELTR